jgi:hypothetical protein
MRSKPNLYKPHNVEVVEVNKYAIFEIKNEIESRLKYKIIKHLATQFYKLRYADEDIIYILRYASKLHELLAYSRVHAKLE